MSGGVRPPPRVYAWAPTWPSGRVLGWLLISAAAVSAVNALTVLWRLLTTPSGDPWSRTAASPLGLAGAPVILACEILWLVWQHRATADLWARREPGMRFTPGWAVGWWFVPVASFVQPFRAIRELARRAGRSGVAATPGEAAVGDGVLVAWWIAWVITQIIGFAIGAFVGYRAGRAGFATLPGAPTPFDITDAGLRAIAAWTTVSGLCTCAAGLLAARIVWAISKAEDVAPMLAPPLAGIPPRPDR